MKQFYFISKGNTLGHNLTELNAADAVDKGFASHNDWLGHLVRYQQVQDFIRKEKANTIVDVGCGRMNLIKYLWRNRSTFEGTYIGMDLRATPKWLDDIGWEKGDIHLFQMDVVKDDLLPSYRGDVVVCLEVMEHLPKDKHVDLFKRLAYLTHHGGLLLFSTPNAGVSDSVASNHQGEDGVREREYNWKIVNIEEQGFDFIDAFGSFMRMDRIPEASKRSNIFNLLRRKLPYAWFSVLAASIHPEQSNNALMAFRRRS